MVASIDPSARLLQQEILQTATEGIAIRQELENQVKDYFKSRKPLDVKIKEFIENLFNLYPPDVQARILKEIDEQVPRSVQACMIKDLTKCRLSPDYFMASLQDWFNAKESNRPKPLAVKSLSLKREWTLAHKAREVITTVLETAYDYESVQKETDKAIFFMDKLILLSQPARKIMQTMKIYMPKIQKGSAILIGLGASIFFKLNFKTSPSLIKPLRRVIAASFILIVGPKVVEQGVTKYLQWKVITKCRKIINDRLAENI